MKSPYRHVGFVRFPVDENAAFQDLGDSGRPEESPLAGRVKENDVPPQILYNVCKALCPDILRSIRYKSTDNSGTRKMNL